MNTHSVLIRVLEPGRFRYISGGICEDRIDKQDGLRKLITHHWKRGDVLLVNAASPRYGVRCSEAVQS
jgi:hypothetical protein